MVSISFLSRVGISQKVMQAAQSFQTVFQRSNNQYGYSGLREVRSYVTGTQAYYNTLYGRAVSFSLVLNT
jgi:hypothetical protein